MNKKIDPKKFYSLYEIIKESLIPGADTHQRLKALVMNDSMTNDYFKASKFQRGLKGVQYSIQGINIIKYLANKDDQKK